MSGHNRWSKVKRIKGPIDAKRGKIFTKIIREITVAARTGGGNPDGNPRLRTAIANAKANSMPKDNIDRAVKKGTGELAGESIEEMTYEGYGPGGVAIIVEAVTDNKNRTVNDLRVLFKTGGGNLGEQGSVAWMFDRCGQMVFDGEKNPEDKIMEVALEAGAQDVSASNGSVEVITAVNELNKVQDAFDRVGMHPVSTGFGYVPKSTIEVDKDHGQKLLDLLNDIEEHDDVQKVHANFAMDEKLLHQLTQES